MELLLGVDPPALAEAMDAADLLVTSPSISARFPTTEPWLRDLLAEAERRGVELAQRGRALPAPDAGADRGRHRHEGQDDDRLAHRRDPRARPASRASWAGTSARPLIERADELTDATWAVLELSELQLPTISRGADVAVYTNIGADHIDRHGSVAAYRAVKARLAELSAQGTVVLNADDPGCRDLGATPRRRRALVRAPTTRRPLRPPPAG